MTQRQILEATDAMCIESCSPAQFEAWENLKNYLIETRKTIDESPDSKDDHWDELLMDVWAGQHPDVLRVKYAVTKK